MIKEFREFIARGNVIDLAVAVIIGAAFGKIVTSLVEGIIMPPIGMLLGGVDFANLFLDKGTIGYLQGQRVTRQNFDAIASKQISKLPLAVITNRGTADGAEVAAAAILENKRGEVVGERTYGAAAMRKAVSLDDGSAIILAVAKYYSPSGKAIQDTFVTPNVLQADADAPADTDDDPNDPNDTPAAKPGTDLPLERAMKLLITIVK